MNSTSTATPAAPSAAPTATGGSGGSKPATTLFKIPLLPHDSLRVVSPPDPGGLVPGGVLVVSANALHFVQVGGLGGTSDGWLLGRRVSCFFMCPCLFCFVHVS